MSSQLIQLAKQGNAKAIASLINQSLQAKGIKIVKYSLKEGCLNIMLVGEKIPEQQEMTSFIRRRMMKLNIPSLQSVHIYAKNPQQQKLLWQEKISLKQNKATPKDIESKSLDKKNHQNTSQFTQNNISSRTNYKTNSAKTRTTAKTATKDQNNHHNSTPNFDLETLMNPRLWTKTIWRWVLGVSLLIASLGAMLDFAIWTALCWIIVGCLLIPPLCKWIVTQAENRFNITLHRFVIIGVGIFFFLASGLGIPDTEQTATTTESSPTQAEQTETTTESSATSNSSSTVSPNTQTSPDEKNHYASDVVAYCRMRAESFLKFPSTAKHSKWHEPTLNNSNVWQYDGWVQGENSLGQNVKTKYQCLLRDSDEATMENVSIFFDQ